MKVSGKLHSAENDEIDCMLAKGFVSSKNLNSIKNVGVIPGLDSNPLYFSIDGICFKF